MREAERLQALESVPLSLDGHVQLFCIPYAGAGSQAYESWISLLPYWIDTYTLRLPGREGRFNEPPAVDALVLGQDLAKEIVPFLGGAFAIFGHSMGALIAFELARELESGYGRRPGCLAVSGMRAPQHAATAPRYSALPDRELATEIRRMSGSRSPVFDEADLWSLTLPILRADLALCDRYEYRDGSRLSCPIVAYGSREDEDLDEELLRAWGEQTKGTFHHRMFPGNHFYFQSWPEAFAMDLVARLDQYVLQR